MTRDSTPEDEDTERSLNRERSWDRTSSSERAEGERLRRHARQLAAMLRARHQELDRREAMLNARQAQWEDEQRAARLWVREQIEAQTCRSEQFDQRARELTERLASLEADKMAEIMRQDAVQQRENDLILQETQLSQRWRQLEAREAELRDAERRCREQRQASEQQAAVQQQKLAVEWRRLAEQQRALLAIWKIDGESGASSRDSRG